MAPNRSRSPAWQSGQACVAVGATGGGPGKAGDIVSATIRVSSGWRQRPWAAGGQGRLSPRASIDYTRCDDRQATTSRPPSAPITREDPTLEVLPPAPRADRRLAHG